MAQLIRVRWNEPMIRFESRQSVADGRFYVLVSAVLDSVTRKWGDFSLHYIGQAFDSTAAERVGQPHTAYGTLAAKVKKWPQTRRLFVMTGDVVDGPEPVSRDLVDDVEALFIFRSQPSENDLCKASYGGRSLIVRNEGDFRPLAEMVFCCPAHEQWKWKSVSPSGWSGGATFRSPACER